MLGLTHELFGACPAGYVLGVRGYAFNEYGERLSPAARENLAAATRFLKGLLQRGDFEAAADAIMATDREVPIPVKEVEICKTENT